MSPQLTFNCKIIMSAREFKRIITDILELTDDIILLCVDNQLKINIQSHFHDSEIIYKHHNNASSIDFLKKNETCIFIEGEQNFKTMHSIKQVKAILKGISLNDIVTLYLGNDENVLLIEIVFDFKQEKENINDLEDKIKDNNDKKNYKNYIKYFIPCRTEEYYNDNEIIDE